jgi:hypothetical protein
MSDRYERLAFAVANYLTAHDALAQGAWDDDSGAINWWTEEMRDIIQGEEDAEG